MQIPDYVLNCMRRLEKAGFAAYIVGGCVRDAQLGLVPEDWDMCTAALPEQTEAVFSDHALVLAGKKHGTVGVICGHNVVEITTFRTEGDYTDNRHPEWVTFVPSIGEDLARRDFTVNAMAYSSTRGFADPFGGRDDLQRGILRAVGDPAARFREDSLRILRGARFAAKYRLLPETKTMDAMISLRHLTKNLARERVFSELCKLLTVTTTDDLLRFAPVLGAVIPELEPQFGFEQHSRHHAYDLFTHTAVVTAGVPADLTLRWAALLHDTGKISTFTIGPDGQGHFYGHAQTGAKIADDILRRLKAPTKLREDAVRLIDLHMTKIPTEKKAVRRWLGRLGEETMDALLTLQEADMGSKGTGIPEESEQFPQLRALIAEIQAENACLSLKDLAVNGNDLKALGFSGRQIGICLNNLLNMVMDEQLPNEREALIKFTQEASSPDGYEHPEKSNKI